MSEAQKQKATSVRSNARSAERVCGSLGAVDEQEAARLVFSSRLLGVCLFGRGEASWCDMCHPCTKLFGPMITF